MAPHGKRRTRILLLYFGISLAVSFGLVAAPVANPGGPYTIDEGDDLELDASGSTGATLYNWDLDDDGIFGDTTGVNPTVSWNDVVGYGMADDGVYTIWLSACDATTCQTESTTVSVANTPPEVDAGGPYPIPEGQDVTLGGSATDPSSADVLSFFWDLNDDASYSESPPEGYASPDITVTWSTLVALGVDGEGDHTLVLKAEDDDSGAATDTATLQITNVPPTAHAGGSYIIDEGEDAILDASGSHDPVDDALTFTWDLNGDAVFGDATGETPTVSWDTLETLGLGDNGAYTITVRVSDGTDTDTDTAELAVLNVSPTAVADGPYFVTEGNNLSLDGTASSDPSQADILTFTWDLDGDGFYDDVLGASSVVFWATLEALGVGDDGTYPVGLRVSDDDGGSDDDATTLTIINGNPSCDANGPYEISEGDDITLKGSGSDPAAADRLTYFWDLDHDGDYDENPPNDPADPLDTPNVFVAWSTLDGLSVNDGDFDGTEYTLTLKVEDDDGGWGTGTAALTILNTPPTLTSHGGPYMMTEGGSVVLNAAATDPSSADEAVLTYGWELNLDASFDDVVGDSVTVPWSGLDNATIGIRDDGVYTISVRVDDGDTGTDTGTTTLTVLNANPTAVAGGPYSTSEGSGVSLSGSGSDPSSVDTLSYAWDLDVDGEYDDATGADPFVDWSTLYGLGIDDDGAYTIWLRVTDDDGGVGTSSAVLSVTNTAPTADADGPYTINEGSDLTLDGSGSSDPGADVLTFYWDLDWLAPGFELITTSTSPTVSWGTLTSLGYGDQGGPHDISLHVQDDDGGWSFAVAASFTVLSLPPVVSAGGPYAIYEGGSVVLSGSAYDPNPNDAIDQYAWDTDGNGFPEVSAWVDLRDASLVETVPWAHFLTDDIDDDGTYDVIQLQARDDDDVWGYSPYVSLTVHNTAPTATSAGGPYAMNEGDSLTLTGYGTDPSPVDMLTCNWDLNNDGTYDVATSSVLQTAMPVDVVVPWTTFESLAVTDGDADGTSYTIKMAVSDDDGGWSTPLTVTLTITNTDPDADAGGPYTIAEGDGLQLDATATSDDGGDPLTFEWDLDEDGDYSDGVFGEYPFVNWGILYDHEVDDDTGSPYTIGLRVTDKDSGQDTSTALLTITNSPPTAEANGPYVISAGSALTVHGAGTSDPGRDSLTFHWGVTDWDNAATSTDPLGVAIVSWATLEGLGVAAGHSYVVYLRVDDGDGGEGTDTADLIVGSVEISIEAGGPYTIAEGQDLQLAGVSSAPGDKDLAWDLDGDLDFDDGIAPIDAPLIPWDDLIGFGFDDEGTYINQIAFRMIDDLSDEYTDYASLVITNTAPTIVHIAAPYIINEGTTFTASTTVSDPSPVDRDRMACVWDLNNDGLFRDGDATGPLPPRDDPIPFFTSVPWEDLLDLGLASNGTPLTITLGAYDGSQRTEVPTTTLTILNLAPLLDVVDPYTVAEGESLRLDARDTTDPGNDPLTFVWDLDNDGIYTDGVTGSYPLVDWATLSAYGIDDDDHSPDHSSPYTIGLRVDDGEGGVSEGTVTVNVTNTPPTPDANGPYDIYEGLWASAGTPGPPFAPLVLDASGSTDPGADTLHYAWDLDNDGTYETDTGTSASFSVDWPTLEAIGVNDDGEYTIAVRVDDEDGGLAVDTARLTIHNSRPTVTSAGGPYSINEGDSLTLTGAATDPCSDDTFAYVWDIDGKPLGDPDFDDGTHGFTKTVPWDVLVLFGLGDGGVPPTAYTVRLTVMDDDGLIDQAEQLLEIRNTAPVLLTCPDPFTVYHDELVTGLTGTFVDPGTDVWSGTIDWNGDGTADDTITIDPAAQAYTLPDHVYSYAPEGATDYFAEVVITDDDGESGACTFTVTVIHDVVGPTVVFTETPPNPSASLSAYFAWIGTDDFADPSEILYSYNLDEGGWSDWSSSTDLQFERLSEGWHVFDVRAKDRAGNVSDPIRYIWLIDVWPPVIQINVPVRDAGYILRSLVLTDWRVFDLLSDVIAVTATLPSGDPIDTTEIGNFSFTVHATDAAGNTGESIVPYRVVPRLVPTPPGEPADGSEEPGDGAPSPIVIWSFLDRPLPTHYDEEGNLVIDPIRYTLGETIGISFRLSDANGDFLIYDTGNVYIDILRAVPLGPLEEYELVAFYEVPYVPDEGRYACEIPFGEADDWWALTPGAYVLSLSIKATPLESVRIETIWIEIVEDDG
jgi:hypothetical protein